MNFFMNKKIFALLALMLSLSCVTLFAQSSKDSSKEGQAVEAADSSVLKYVAAAVAVGVACIGGGIAVGKIGAAAMGAMSENAELSGKALPFVGLAEGICLWGFLVALLIIM